MTETYYVVVGSYETGSLRLHTDPQCTYLKDKEFRPVTREKMPSREVCQRCAGNDKRAGGDFSIYNAAVEAGKNDD